jgi:hypothetical protein
MSRLAADYKLHKASAQQQQQQQHQQSHSSQQPGDLQPMWQQQQLDEVLVEDAQLEVVELSDSEDEAGGCDSQQQQQQASWDAPGDQEDVGGLLSFMQQLDLAGAD